MMFRQCEFHIVMNLKQAAEVLSVTLATSVLLVYAFSRLIKPGTFLSNSHSVTCNDANTLYVESIQRCWNIKHDRSIQNPPKSQTSILYFGMN